MGKEKKRGWGISDMPLMKTMSLNVEPGISSADLMIKFYFDQLIIEIAKKPTDSPDPSVAASDKDKVPVKLSEVAIVAAPIAPDELLPGTKSTSRLNRLVCRSAW